MNDIEMEILEPTVHPHKSSLDDTNHQNNNNNNFRSKIFNNSDHSLRYEKERLETFIEWPIPWLSPEELAADGFYYLRTLDHCACFFCRGIIGVWEEGDTPRGEHTRHFPQCPFVKGRPVGNIPLRHSAILDKLPLVDNNNYSTTITNHQFFPGRYMPGSYAECKGNLKNNNNNNDILFKHYPPKFSHHITVESRIKTFTKWPENMTQKPIELSEAGFFYHGVSDHTTCYHCGGGIRNWENEDDPWEEHARWYPDCLHISLFKGKEFIDEIFKKKPPVTRSVIIKDDKPEIVTKKSNIYIEDRFVPLSEIDSNRLMEYDIIEDRSVSLSEIDLNRLMEYDIIEAAIRSGYESDVIKLALVRTLERTGTTFTSTKHCLDAISNIVNEKNGKDRKIPGEESKDVVGCRKERKNAENEIYVNFRNLKIYRREGQNYDNNGNYNNQKNYFELHDCENDNENQTISQDVKEKNTIFEANQCTICMDDKLEIVFIPCKHMISCHKCACKLKNCPNCRKKIEYSLKPIMP